MKTYSEKLKDPRWQRKRLEIMERDGFACVRCRNKEDSLHVHHAYYGKGNQPWEYEDRHLITLCENCHKTTENWRESLLKAVADPECLTITVLFAAAATNCRAEDNPGRDATKEMVISMGDVLQMAHLMMQNQIVGIDDIQECVCAFDKSCLELVENIALMRRSMLKLREGF